jgi:hypothetical protein
LADAERQVSFLKNELARAQHEAHNLNKVGIQPRDVIMDSVAFMSIFGWEFWGILHLDCVIVVYESATSKYSSGEAHECLIREYLSIL